MTDLTTEANRLLALAEKATPGPWHAVIHTTGGDNCDWTIFDKKNRSIAYEGSSIGLPEGDAAFIAASHDMADCIRKLLAENEALRLANEEAENKAEHRLAMFEQRADLMHSLQKAAAVAEERAEALRKDADRYRWLRDDSMGLPISAAAARDPNKFDAAIDAARNKE